MAVPARGEIWFVNLNPGAGREQQGLRPVLIVSEKAFNSLGLCVMCPITQDGQPSRFAGFAVTLMGAGTQTQGIIMCNQPRTIDMNARSGRFTEAVPAQLIEEVLARIQSVFESGT